MKLRIFCVVLAFIVWAGFACAADGDVLFKNANELDQIGGAKGKVLAGEDIKPITIVGPINGTL